MHPTELVEADPFDLPEWLGVAEVTWEAEEGLHGAHLVRGRLVRGRLVRDGLVRDHRAGAEDEALACGLLGVDQAYPAPVVDDTGRSRAHQVWQHGQVLVAHYGHQLVLAVPGAGFDADRAIDALGRLALAVGADADRYSLRLRIGSTRRR